MTALDDLSEVEVRVPKTDHACQTAGKVAQAIRSWKEEESQAPPTRRGKTIDLGQSRVSLRR